jgi:cysteine synthase A
MSLSLERKEKFDKLEAKVGKTPLIEITVDKRFNIPRGNRIFAKKEFCNPTGSHYDRYWVRYFRLKEEQGKIDPNLTSPLLETSTGNSGAAFAWVCRELGYPCEVFIPKDMPGARIEQIKHYNACVSYSPQHQYVDGLIKSFRERIETDKGKYRITNHANDQDTGVWGIYDLGTEIIGDLQDMGIPRIDYFVSALGNGLTTRWIGKCFRERFGNSTYLYGMEPKESPTVFQLMYPDKFKQLGLTTCSNGEHELIGTGPGIADFSFPNMREAALTEKLIKDIILESHEDWMRRSTQLSTYLNENVGHTSAACLDSAIKLIDQNQKIQNKIFVVIFYDEKWKYLDHLPQEHRN